MFSLCDEHNLKATTIHQAKGKVGFQVSGKGAAKLFSREAGKHVVQRCPPTENKGRRHTSTVTVSVLALVPEREFALNKRDIETKTQRGHGPGGQHQNKTDSAVRMVHVPTGTTVFVNGRDQHANRREARRILESRVANIHDSVQRSQRAKAKREQVDGGGRGNKIRTYNFIDGRAVDHRSGKKTSKLKQVMKGRFDLLT
ncbi:peptide chain release factor-like protein [Hydrogenophaga sp.]|uniref:peptide chain release factor-like protein n=1 Tax=Hydrogenophaga sp. TaxID=1904254 RepID=UPI0034523231